MAEGHLLHRAARDLNALLAGAPARVTSPQGKFAAGAAQVDGRVLVGAEAWGKHLFVAFEGDRVVHVHLGLAGTIARVSAPDIPPRPQARARIAGERAAFDVYAPSVCEVGGRALRDRVVARLGPDPLRDDTDAEVVLAALRERPEPIGAALLDQALLSGVGNVFRAEALHLVGVHPGRPARDLTEAERRALWDTLVRLMRQAVEDGRIVTRRAEGARARVADGRAPEQDASGSRGTSAQAPARARGARARSASGSRRTRPADERWVYKQARCQRCGGSVEEEAIGGRTSYACPRCQPRRVAVARS